MNRGLLGSLWCATLLFACDRKDENEAEALTTEAVVSAKLPASSTPSERAKPRASKEARGLGWKLSDGNNELYLVGSVHVGNEALYPIPRRIEAAFQSSAMLVEELRLDEAMSPESQKLFVSRGMYPSGETLNENLPLDLVALLKKRASFLGALAPSHQKMRPWLLGTAMSMQELGKKGFVPEKGLDAFFAEEAQKRQIEYHALETVEGQSSALASLSQEVQILMLRETLEEIETVAAEIAQVLHAWTAGDSEKIDEIMMRSFRDPKMRPAYQALFVDRNRRMQKKILEYLKTPAVEFVVVGAGHLVGKDGLVHTLENEGRRLTQL